MRSDKSPKKIRCKTNLFFLFSLLAALTTAQTNAFASAIAAGKDHTLAIKENGTVWAWGNNSHGQLGNGTKISSFIPVQVKGLSNIAAVAAGENHSVALNTDGTVWRWGNLNCLPVKLTGIPDVSAIAAGGEYTILLKSDGTVWKLSNGTPAQIAGIDDVSMIATSDSHSVAVKNDGTVWEWDNSWPSMWSITPAQRQGLSDVTAIEAGYYFTIALTSDGAIWKWDLIADKPEIFPGLNNIGAIAAGDRFSLVAKTDGTVWGWGDNSAGQLGDGGTADSQTPIQVPGISNVSVIAAGSYYSIALKQDGSLWGWGDNEKGQLGFESELKKTTPVQVSGLNDIIAVAAGAYHNISLMSDGTVWAWGDNGNGQIGDGTVTSKNIPVQVPGLTDVSAVSAGGNRSIALKTDGTVWSWGYEEGPWLSCSGSRPDTKAPLKTLGLSDISAIAAGERFGITLKNDGTAWTWGDNWHGQLGNGTHVNHNNCIVQVSGISDVSAISAGNDHGVAVLTDGTVWTWGRNFWGGLGDGTYNNSYVPVQVSEIFDVYSVSAGMFFTIALKNDGTVWAWGENWYGQLGNENVIASSNIPVQVQGLFDISIITAGGNHAIVMDADETLWGWGVNDKGQLGDGTTINRHSPVQLSAISDVSSVEAGAEHTIALKKDGTVWAWGGNSFGQLGDGSIKWGPAESFFTLYDNISPSVSLVSPGDGADSIITSDAIIASFSEVMDALTITTETFTVYDETSLANISGTVTYNGIDATFTPLSDLNDNSTYTATITGQVADLSGNLMGHDYSWSFTTNDASNNDTGDNLPPTLVSTSPLEGAKSVSIIEAIMVIFSEDMDASTMTATTFVVYDETSMANTSGTITADGSGATFTPLNNLSYSTTYTVTIKGDVADLSGNLMGNAYSWSFTTVDNPANDSGSDKGGNDNSCFIDSLWE